MFYDFEEIRDRAQEARAQELARLLGVAVLALARGVDHVIGVPAGPVWRLDPEDRPGC
jgi:hypothetical protein